MRAAVAILIAILACLSSEAATLQQLSLDEMSRKSTLIARGKVTGCSGEVQRTVIFTHCTLLASEVWKGAPSSKIDFYVPGGQAKGLLQRFTGTPQISTGQEYLFFLWAGRSGMNQIIGLSQGAFTVLGDLKGAASVKRAASTERILDAAGQPVQDHGIEMNLDAMRSKVLSSLGKAAR